MFLYGQRSIPITEYDSNSIRTTGIRAAIKPAGGLAGQISIRPLRLSVAMARGILSLDPTNFDLLVHAFASFVHLQSVIDSGSSQLRLVDGFRRRFRDFSQAAKTGELAQGITYLFSMDILGYPRIVDYNGFLAKHGLPTVTTKDPRPDFVLFGKHPGVLDLIDSKGTCRAVAINKVKSALRKALDQGQAGRTHICATSTKWRVGAEHGVLLKFAEALDTSDTGLHYCDPDGEQESDHVDEYPLTCFHYATWFAMLGYWREAVSLVHENRLPTRARFPDTFEYHGTKYVGLNSRHWYPNPMMSFISPFWDDFGEWHFGIAQEVFEALLPDSPTRHSGKPLRIYKTVSEREVESFSDGTILLGEG